MNMSHGSLLVLVGANEMEGGVANNGTLWYSGLAVVQATVV